MRDFFRPGRSPVHAGTAAVSTSHPLATAAALDVLRSGGNAVDAALAAVAVHSIVDPLMTGLGGDCFALYAPKGATTPIAINGSGRAPSAATTDWFVGQKIAAIAPTSPHAVTIPGAVATWAKLAEDHGTKSLAELFQPAIAYAEGGYPVGQRVAWDWNRLRARVQHDSDAAALFLPGGRAPKAGDKMVNPKLGATLRLIGEKGPSAFYEGAVAQDIVGKLRSLGGLHTLEDFAGTKPEYVAPITTRYRGYNVYECPPNGQGLVALMMLNALSHSDIGALDEIDRVHRFAEICKAAYHHRDALIADMGAVDVPIKRLLSEEWSRFAHHAVHPQKAGVARLHTSTEHKDTIYLCVVDAQGNAISFINSLFQGFGSGIVAPQSGVLLHNRGISFRIAEGHPNTIAPRKRPLHTIIPGMLMKDGRAVAPFGVMGGHYQAMGHVELLTGLLDRGLDVQAALDAPRSFAFNGALEIEPTFGEATRAALAAKGHTIAIADAPLGGGQVIWIDHARGVLAAGSDCRKDGFAAGF